MNASDIFTTSKIAGWLKHYWKPMGIGTVFMTLLALVGGYNDAVQLWESLFAPTKLELGYTSDGEVHPGGWINVVYKAADKGHLSLWNQSSSGITEKKLPTHGMGTVSLNPRIASSQIRFPALNETGTDRFILIWTPEGTPQHLPRNQYTTPAEFEAALKALENRSTMQKAEISVPVYP